jgi:tRNA threonylcarbamoyladenosine biosynthesis protein TsaB
MAKILAIETCTEACTLALDVDGDVRGLFQIAPRQHQQRVFEMAQHLLDAAGIRLQDLDLLAAGRGPGAFTGVRIGIAAAQGLAYGAGLPVVGLSTLETIAASEIPGPVARTLGVAIDARMGEIYQAVYQLSPGGDLVTVSPEVLVAPQAAVWPVRLDAALGTGFQCLNLQQTDILVDRHRLPDARHMLPRARQCLEKKTSIQASALVPVYLRNSVAKKSAR